MTIVHPKSGVGRHSLSFVVVVLRGVVIARERRESSFQYDRRTFVIVASFWSRRSVHRRFVGDYMRRYDYCSSERRVGGRKVEFQESSSFQEDRNIIGRTTLSIFQFHRSCGVALVVGGDLRLTFNFHGSNLRMQGTPEAWRPIGVSFRLLATAEAGIWFRYNIFTTMTTATTVISSFCGIMLEDLHQFRSRYQK